MEISLLNSVGNFSQNFFLDRMISRIDKKIVLIAITLFAAISFAILYIYKKWGKHQVEKVPEYTVDSKGEKVFTLAQVQDSCKRGNFWLIIEGNVYDVTDFQHRHPGGVDVLLDFKGKDATEVFNSIGHTDSARSILKEHFIGKYQAS